MSESIPDLGPAFPSVGDIVMYRFPSDVLREMANPYGVAEEVLDQFGYSPIVPAMVTRVLGESIDPLCVNLTLFPDGVAPRPELEVPHISLVGPPLACWLWSEELEAEERIEEADEDPKTNEE